MLTGATGILSVQALAQSMYEGTWILEMKRTDAPLELRKCEIIKNTDGSFSANLARANGQSQPLQDFAFLDGNLSFTFHGIDLQCVLELDSTTDKIGTWNGTCPPGGQPDSGDFLTIRIRLPIGVDDQKTLELSPEEEPIKPNTD